MGVSGDGATFVDDVSSTPFLHQYNVVNVLHIGSDTDGDGIADSLEDEGANDGDMNNDSIPDRDQQGIATYRAITGNLVTLEAAVGVLLEFTSFMGKTFGFSTYDVTNPPAVLDGFDFVHGHLGFNLNNIMDPEGKATVTVSITSCHTINSYFQYGPTPDDLTPHWYEFLYDAVTDTGAEINGNVITMHYVDGERGDSALGVAGIIETQGGAASTAALVLDNDGVPQFVEGGAANAGDGNDDGACDSEQNSVASLPDARGNYVTAEVPPALSLSAVSIFDGTNLLLQADPPSILQGLNFASGFLTFKIGGLANDGDSVDVRLIFPGNNFPVSYFKFGPTPDNLVPHLYEFLFDEVTGTGAEFNGNEITLHLVDGKRGDSDVVANSVIFDPGAPAVFAATISPDGGGSSGCRLGGGTSRPAQAGAWYLLLLLTVLHGIWRHYRRIHLDA